MDRRSRTGCARRADLSPRRHRCARNVFPRPAVVIKNELLHSRPASETTPPCSPIISLCAVDCGQEHCGDGLELPAFRPEKLPGRCERVHIRFRELVISWSAEMTGVVQLPKTEIEQTQLSTTPERSCCPLCNTPLVIQRIIPSIGPRALDVEMHKVWAYPSGCGRHLVLVSHDLGLDRRVKS